METEIGQVEAGGGLSAPDKRILELFTEKPFSLSMRNDRKTKANAVDSH